MHENGNAASWAKGKKNVGKHLRIREKIYYCYVRRMCTCADIEVETASAWEKKSDEQTGLNENSEQEKICATVTLSPWSALAIFVSLFLFLMELICGEGWTIWQQILVHLNRCSLGPAVSLWQQVGSCWQHLKCIFQFVLLTVPNSDCGSCFKTYTSLSPRIQWHSA